MSGKTIAGLKLLDERGLEWEWRYGQRDFHCQYDDGVGAWVLEIFDSQVTDAERAHLDEFECESLQDALLTSLE